jgi:arginine:pyruvate transaminase
MRTVQFSSRVGRIGGKGAGAWAIHFAALKQRAAGRDIIFLTVGDPDQPPPEPVIEATVQALRDHRTGYSPIIGLPEVRAAIAERFQRRTGRPCGAENVVVVPGAQAGLYGALQCLAGPGDEVIVPEPVYATYEAVVGASGASMVNVPLSPDTGFHPHIADLARAVTPRSRVIWINTPHNPTGAVLSLDEVAAIADVCRRHDLWLLSDEVYEDLAYARPHVSPWGLPNMADRTVVVSSLSKSHAIPGFRFGWIIAPPDLVAHLFNLILCMLYGGPPFIQDAALVALRDDLPQASSMRETYRNRALHLTRVLKDAPNCRVAVPEGGMFVLLDVRGTQVGSEEFAFALLAEEAVAVLPCDGFGPSAVGHLRISLTASEEMLGEAGRRIVRFARQFAGGRG